MIEREREEFGSMMADVYEFYGKEPSLNALEIWWIAMRPFDLQAVRKALGQHAVNPDTGQFLPKPADAVKMLGGSTLDSALLAWSKFELGLQRVGPHCSVVFDDPLIHRVVEDMGGWVVLARSTLKEWPFRQNEFVNRYRGFKIRNETPAYPSRLIGIAEGENTSNGFFKDEAGQRKLLAETVLIGDPGDAQRVLAGGSAIANVQMRTLAEVAAKQIETRS